MTLARISLPLLFATFAAGLAREALAFTPDTVDTPYAAQGFDATHAAMSEGEESVDLFSGALNLQYVDHEIPGSRGLPIQVLRAYSSKILDETYVPYDESWVGLGWELHFGRYREDATAGAGYKWIELPGQGVQRAYSLSASDALYRSATATNHFPSQYSTSNELWVTADFNFMYRSGASEYSVITPQGVVYVFATGSSASDGWTYCKEIYNATGGDITITYKSSGTYKPGAISSVTNNDGYGVTFTVDTNGYLATMAYTAADGSAAEVDYTVEQDASTGEYVLTGATEPTGEETAFGYDDTYDELSTITLPTGGVTTYSFTDTYFLWHVDHDTTQHVYPTRTLTSKVVDVDASTSDTWLYDFPDYYDDSDATKTTRTTIVDLPTGGSVEHTFNCYWASFSGSTESQQLRYLIGKPKKTEWFDPSNTTARREEYTSWSGTGSYGNYLELSSVDDDPFDPDGLSARTVVPYWTETFQDSTSDQALQRTYGHTEDGAYDDYGNAFAEYDIIHTPYAGYGTWTYGRRTEHSYAWSDATLSGWNLVHLPASETMGATSSGTSLSATFRDAAWTYTTATGFVGLPATYDSAAYPAANASDDESRDYTWTWDGTYHVLKVSIDHGGEREERRSWRFGTLNREGFLKGSSVVWTVVRDIDGPTGLVMSDANGNGDSTDYTYDDAGRLLTMSPADDDPTSVTYALTSTPPTVTLDGAAGTITYTYDGVGRVLTTTQPNGTGTTTTKETEWDALSRPATVYLPFETTASGYVQTSFDVLDRPTQVDRVDVADSDTLTSTFSYSKLQVTVQNARSKSTTTDADGYGKVWKTNAPAGADFLGADGVIFTTPFYGDHGLVENSAGTSALYEQDRYLDGEGRMWRLLDQQVSTTAYSYVVRNAAGDVGYQYDPASHYIDYTYGYDGQLRGTYFETSFTASGTPEIGYTYDGDSMGTVPSGWTYSNPIGNRTGIRDETGLEQYAFDDQNRVLAFRRAFTNFGNAIVGQTYTRDAAGDIDSIDLRWTSNRHVVTSYTYGDGDKVEGISVAITNPSGTVTKTVLSDATYEPDGTYATMTFDNGVVQTRTVDGLGRTSGISTTGAATNLGLTYTWDDNDNLATEHDSGGTDTYTYDDIDRLTYVSYGDDSTSETYTWDEAGNMTNRSGITATAFPSSQTFTYNHDTAWTYDSVGELTSDTHKSFTYNYRGMVATSSATSPTTSAAITYDYAGRRSVRATTSGGVTHYEIYIYDALGRLYARFSAATLTSTPVMEEIYVYLGNTAIAVIDYSGSYPDGRVHWMHSDHIGTVRMVTGGVSGASAVVVGTQEMYPFGLLRASTGSLLQDDVAYAGHERFDPYGVSDFGARSFHAPSNAFVSPDRDQIGTTDDPMSFNRYGYARGNPMKYTDPDGRNPIAVAAGGYVAADAALTWTDIAATAFLYYEGDEMRAPLLGLTAVGAGAGPAFPNGTATAYVALKYGGGVLEDGADYVWAMATGTQGGARAGKAFTPGGKGRIDAGNASANGGVNVCENCGTTVVAGQRSQKGVSPPGNERQRDHIIPKSKGGDGAPENGQVLCRDCNLEKSDKTP